jgi:pimeloyl-ACP methyl ester carboxylesterase
MQPPLVRKRCFVQLIGYEPVGVEHQHRRFIREMARFQNVWNVQGKVSSVSLSADGAVAHWTVDTCGVNWRVATDYYYFRWDDFVSADMQESDWWRFPLGIAAVFEFILTGTAIKYFAVAWRYGCFFLLPLFYIVGMALLSIGLTRGVESHSFNINTNSSDLPYLPLWAPLLAFAVFMVLRLTFGRMLLIRFALDDWYFARDFIHRVRPRITERLDRFALELVRLVRETDADEIIVDGHSLGAPLSLVVIDRALELDPLLGECGKLLHIVSSGSSLLKLALHPAAAWLRKVVERVANSPAIYWVDFQAKDDIINAYRVETLVALGIPATGKPVVKIIHIRPMLKKTTYRRLRINYPRIHRQAMMGNERRYFYDYYMLCCSPIPLIKQVADSDVVVAAFSANGTWIGAGSTPLPDLPQRP